MSAQAGACIALRIPVVIESATAIALLVPAGAAEAEGVLNFSDTNFRKPVRYVPAFFCTSQAILYERHLK